MNAHRPGDSTPSLAHDLERRADLEAIVARMSVSFAGDADGGLDQAISSALAEIGRFVEADRSYVFLHDLQARTMSNTHEWCAEGISAEKAGLQELPLEVFPYLVDRLDRELVVDVPAVADLPPEAASEKEILEAQGIQSVILVAMHNRAGQTIGFMGFDAVSQERPWHVADRHLLQLTSDLISAALESRGLRQCIEDNEARFGALLAAIPDTMVTFTGEGQVLGVQISNADPYPWLSRELLNTNLPDFLGPQQAAVFRDTVARVEGGENPAVAEFHLERGDLALSFEVSVTRYATGEYMALVRDVTQRKRDEAALRSLALQLGEVEEAQRRELAFLLHDGIGQDLTALNYLMQECLENSRLDETKTRKMITLLQHAMHKAQDLTFDLSPPVLYELGLAAALQALVRKFNRDHAAQFNLEVIGEEICPGAPTSIILFRIARELLINAVKHSNADRVDVRLICLIRKVMLTVADNGRGFAAPLDVQKGHWKQGGFGLFSISHRIGPLGGSLVAENTGGARITITLPRESTDSLEQTKGRT